jgi:hypothetical protein
VQQSGEELKRDLLGVLRVDVSLHHADHHLLYSLNASPDDGIPVFEVDTEKQNVGQKFNLKPKLLYREDARPSMYNDMKR